MDDVKVYFSYCEVISCAKHIEAKVLANKYWNKMWTISDRISECMLAITEDNTEESVKKVEALQLKHDKVEIEFKGILRSVGRCC